MRGGFQTVEGFQTLDDAVQNFWLEDVRLRSGPAVLYNARVGERRVTAKVFEEHGPERFVAPAVAEVQILAALGRHRNLFPLWEIGLEGRCFVTLVFPPFSRTLAAERAGMPQDECLFVTREVTSGLRHMHDHGLVHTNLQDTTVFVDGPCRPEFGADGEGWQNLVALGRWLLQLPTERVVQIGECGGAVAADSRHRAGTRGSAGEEDGEFPLDI